MDEQDTLERLTLLREVDADGNIFWTETQGGELHRIHGPAIEWASGKKDWFYKGMRHRSDGPAIVFDGGCQYFIYGAWFSKAEFDERRRNL